MAPRYIFLSLELLAPVESETAASHDPHQSTIRPRAELFPDRRLTACATREVRCMPFPENLLQVDRVHRCALEQIGSTDDPTDAYATNDPASRAASDAPRGQDPDDHDRLGDPERPRLRQDQRHESQPHASRQSRSYPTSRP